MQALYRARRFKHGKNLKWLKWAANVLQEQDQFFQVPPDSAWDQFFPKQSTSRYLAWIPPSAFGNDDECMHGGFVFCYTMGGPEKFATFYQIEGTADMFQPSADCGDADVDQARPEASHFLRDLLPFDPHCLLVTESGRTWSLCSEVPYQLRVVTAMLAAMGRTWTREKEVISGKGHYDFSRAELQPPGVRTINIRPDFSEV